jgi:hypothetical protein
LIPAAFGLYFPSRQPINSTTPDKETAMAKPGRKTKKANHGKRPANARARKAKRKKVKTP